jgi:hypothetical protein
MLLFFPPLLSCFILFYWEIKLQKYNQGRRLLEMVGIHKATKYHIIENYKA